MDLLPFAPEYAPLVASWARSAEEAVLWCGEREFPVPARRIAEWQEQDWVHSRLLVADGAAVGYGELWIDDGNGTDGENGEDEAELARIIVAPAARGRGLGRALVRGLAAEALSAGRSEVFLRVHPDNPAALRCYLNAGFAPVDAAAAQTWNAGQPVDYIWLRLPDFARSRASTPD
ncbi:GNAT family N-acetyltransferase [Streptomyces sp. TRM 70361]|uniref:GNAT family N-acetyltransferase n=1 Tax=Streptomyces sp. TRM 70361 TaxID=3116553 RepID=UPI002E7AD2E1|nr:GNAT family N-acetyltransferase [Streptomyces sp. TRM 70361]MEE1938085.1 GNAT family N-acetyltransferase [Streptomyces sp. TRM 70361]